MKDQTSAWLVGSLMTVFAVLGLFLWARAADVGMAVFGCSLLGFGIAGNFFLIGWYYDRLEAAMLRLQEQAPVVVTNSEPVMADAAE